MSRAGGCVPESPGGTCIYRESQSSANAASLRRVPGWHRSQRPGALHAATQPFPLLERAHPPRLCATQVRLHEHQAACRSLCSSCPRAPTAWPVPGAHLSSPCQPTASSRLLTPQASWPAAPWVPAGGIHMLGTCRLPVVSALKNQPNMSPYTSLVFSKCMMLYEILPTF